MSDDQDSEKKHLPEGTVIHHLSDKMCLGCYRIQYDAIKTAPCISLALNLDHLDNDARLTKLKETPPIVLLYPIVVLTQEKCLLCRWIYLAAQHRVAPTEKCLFVFTSRELDGRLQSIWIFDPPLSPHREPVIELDCHAEDGECASDFVAQVSDRFSIRFSIRPVLLIWIN